MHNSVNAKAAGWDIVGGMFWRLGRVSARPSKEEIDIFLKDIKPATRCAIIGASTKELIEEAIKRNIKTTIIDFSSVMCTDLRKDIGSLANRCKIICLDILEPVADELCGSQDYVLADRLINRFNQRETQIFLDNVLAILKVGGEVRTSVKLGFYDMDWYLIDEGKRKGTLKNFFDPTSNTINFREATEELRVSLLPHGNIPRDVLMEWYRHRGEEKRYDDDEILKLLIKAIYLKKRFTTIESQPLPDSRSTIMYNAKVELLSQLH